MATLALCLVRAHPLAAAAVDGAPPEAPVRVSEAVATSATTTTLRDRCEARRMAGTLAPGPRPRGPGPWLSRHAGVAETGAASVAASAGIRIHATT